MSYYILSATPILCENCVAELARILSARYVNAARIGLVRAQRQHRSFASHSVSPLSQRKLIFPSGFFVASWPTLVGSLLVGTILTITVVSLRWQALSSSWREGQVAVAKADLGGIRAVLEFASSHLSADSNLSDLTVLDTSAQRAIRSLAKEGELIWSVADSVPTELSQGSPTPEIRTSWSVEPNGYNRLRLTCFLDVNNEAGNELTLVRRFSEKEFASLSSWDWIWGGSTCIASLLIGLLIATSEYNRKRLLASLAEWSRQSPLAHSSIGDRTANALENLDPNIARILRRATEGMHNSLETIQHSVEQSSRVMSAMPVGVMAFDQQLRFLFVNRAGCELLGLGASIQFGQALIEVIRQPTVVNLIQQVAIEPQIQEVELELPLTKATLRLRAHPLSDPDQSASGTTRWGVLLTVTDETRLKQLENARRDFTANVSHELKTPLSAIKAYAETLLMGALDDGEASHRFIERIAEQANRLDALIRDLLHLTKLQSQPNKPVLSELSLDDVLKTCVEEHRTIGQGKKVTIDTTEVERGCRVEADLESLRTVIGNLLGNAVRYNRAGGWVKVSTRPEADRVVLIIADNGIGIPPEDLDRIFERFYRVEKARSQDAGGTGLGLSIVKHLVQGMSAEIQVSSVLGQGSSFELRLKSAAARRHID